MTVQTNHCSAKQTVANEGCRDPHVTYKVTNAAIAQTVDCLRNRRTGFNPLLLHPAVLNSRPVTRHSQFKYPFLDWGIWWFLPVLPTKFSPSTLECHQHIWSASTPYSSFMLSASYSACCNQHSIKHCQKSLKTSCTHINTLKAWLLNQTADSFYQW